MSAITSIPGYQPKLRRSRGRYSVLLIRCPLGWRPATPRSMPPAVESSRFMVRNVKAGEAAAIAQAYNIGHNGEHFGGEVAVVVSTLFSVTPEMLCRCGK